MLSAATAAACFAGTFAVRQDNADPEPAKKPKSQRWQIGWAVDEGASRIKAPKPTTVSHLLRFKRPKDLPGTGTIPDWYKTRRITGVENYVWRVTGTIVNVAYERDGDYRLILTDSKGNVVTCVAPDPARAPKRGRYSDKIDHCRKLVVEKFHPTLTPRDVKVRATIEGLGYFGRFNSDANKSPEGFQLHPVTSVRFSPAK
jgi:hypothetical protein